MLAFKRAHLGSLALARSMSDRLGLTPSRFEILHYVHTCGSGAPRQFHIKNALGVTAVTISKMVRRLAELGLVKRHRVGRKAFVTLSRSGRARVLQVIKKILEPSYYRHDLQGAWSRRPSRSARVAMSVYRRLRAAIWHVGGSQTHWYPTPFVDRDFNPGDV